MTIQNAQASRTSAIAKARATVTAAALLMTLSAGLAFAQDPNNGAMPDQAGDNGAAQARTMVQAPTTAMRRHRTTATVPTKAAIMVLVTVPAAGLPASGHIESPPAPNYS